MQKEQVCIDGVNNRYRLLFFALDIGLRQLPNPTHQFVLGLDQPIFFTNQSRAKLSEDGSIAVSLIKYHNPMLEMNHIHEDKEQLESTMELLHPNWKEKLLHSNIYRK